MINIKKLFIVIAIVFFSLIMFVLGIILFMAANGTTPNPKATLGFSLFFSIIAIITSFAAVVLELKDNGYKNVLFLIILLLSTILGIFYATIYSISLDAMANIGNTTKSTGKTLLVITGLSELITVPITASLGYSIKLSE